MTTTPQIAQTIIDQLGRRTLFMLGAKNLLDLGNGLQFRIRGSGRVNTIMIELDAGLDLYDVKFYKIGRAPGYKITEVAIYRGVHVEQLHPMIEETTGLRTSL